MNNITVEQIAAEVAAVVAAKNKDYGNSFANTFHEYGFAAYCMRIEDKLNRLKSLGIKNQDAQVKDESIVDTVTDIIGYSLLMAEILRNGKPVPEVNKHLIAFSMQNGICPGGVIPGEPDAAGKECPVKDLDCHVCWKRALEGK